MVISGAYFSAMDIKGRLRSVAILDEESHLATRAECAPDRFAAVFRCAP